MCLPSVCDPVWFIHAWGVGTSRSALRDRRGVSARPGHQERPRPLWNWWETCEYTRYMSAAGFKHSMWWSVSIVFVHYPLSAWSPAAGEEPAVWRWEDDPCLQILLVWGELQRGADWGREEDGSRDQGKSTTSWSFLTSVQLMTLAFIASVGYWLWLGFFLITEYLEGHPQQHPSHWRHHRLL